MSPRLKWVLIVIAALLVAILAYQIPAVNRRLGWRVELASAAVRNIVDPPGNLPAPEMVTIPQFGTPTATWPAEGPTPTAQPSPTALPASVQLDTPTVEFQGPNNCGPATLSLYLQYYGWDGDQYTISDEIKPVPSDRNVNVDELVYYAQNWAGWLKSMYRVGGDVQLLKSLLAAGIPVMVEKGEIIEIDYLFNDDYWAGHYALLTGYDDASQTFTYQDTFRGPDQVMGYAEMDGFWQQFNRVYTLVFLPSQEATVRVILGEHWDVDYNRQAALDLARAETQGDPDNAFAWFNLGMNQVYFEQYSLAAQSFDVARSIGWPQRMLRYQFGPFIAYYHTNQLDVLLDLVDYALRITNVSEEAMIWKGWAYFKQGDNAGAIEMFRLAYETNPKSNEALLALNFMGATP